MGKKTYLLIALIVAVVSIAMQRESLIQKEQQKVLVDYEIEQEDTVRYKNDWREVSALIDSGLPKSARTLLDVMMEKAIQDSNYYEVVKIVQFRLAANSQHQEHFVDSSLQYLQAQSERLPSPASEYVQLLACDLLKNHINWRHPENGVPASDESYQSWSVAFIHDSIIKCQKRLLPLIEQTKKMPHAAFERIKSPNNHFYPTLYDLFIWKMIGQHDHYRFKNEVVKSSKDYYLLATGDEFATAANNLKEWPFVVYLHHMLEKFHFDKKPQTAFINNKIQRLQWVKKHQITPLSEENYTALMEKLWHIHPNNLLTPSIIYEWAFIQYNQLSRKNKNHDFNAVLALANKGLELTKKMIAEKFDKVALKELSKAFESLIMEIKELDFSLEIEEFNLPNEPIAARITFQNLAQEHEDHLVYFNVYEYVDKKGFGPKEYLKEGNLVASFEKQLFDKKAYHSWSTYLKIPGLKVGKYMLIADPKQKFDGTETVNSTFTVTQLTAITQQINQNSFKVEVLDRKTGFPVPNCQVTYHYSESHNENRKITQRSNEKGEVVFQYKSRYSWRNRGIDLALGKDKIHVESNLSQQVGSARESDVSQIFIDRSTYRPGQTLFFKAVSTHQVTLPFSNKPAITLNKKKNLNIQLYDANYEVVWDSVMTTNKFGSVAGSVKLAQNRMTGSWRLRIENSESYFNVEEYKRPTFEASFKKISKEYQFGDSISVTGSATSFSGVPVRKAKVQIAVSRKVNHYLHPRHDKGYYWGIPQSTTADQIMVSKTTNTNSKGQYTITFYAKKEPQFDYQNQYISYSINSSITNLTGETRTANTNISVGRQGFQINANIPKQIDKKGKKQGIVRAVNLNGEPIQQTIKYKVYPSKLSYSAPLKAWKFQPIDTLLGHMEAFKKDFPNQAVVLVKESNTNKQNPILTGKVDQKTMGANTMKAFRNLNSGSYVVVFFSRDKHHTLIETEKTFYVYGRDDKKINGNFNFWVRLDQNNLSPPDTAQIFLGSTHQNLRMSVKIVHNNTLLLSKKWVLNDQIKVLKFPITEQHRGGLSVHVSALKDNQYFEKKILVSVPYDNKNLGVKFETFRDKTKPGSKEKWRAIISNPDSTRAAAEMVATLYDASLDEFSKNNYRSTPINWQHRYFFQNYSQSLFKEATQRNRKVSNRLMNHYYSNNRWQQRSFFQDYKHRTYTNKSLKQLANTYQWMEGDAMVSVRKSRAPVAVSGNKEYTLKSEVSSLSFSDHFASVSLEDEEEGTFKSQLQEKDKKEEQNKTNFLNPTKLQRKLASVRSRQNFNETAFFFPHLKTNKKGEVIIEFTMPESLTSWNFKSFAHTPDLKTGSLFASTITQKDFMITSFAPRFFREDDQIVLTAKIDNISNKVQKGLVQLELIDASTLKPIDNINRNLTFEVDEKGTKKMEWLISIPKNIPTINYSIKAVTDEFGDGEEKTIPILKNSILVRESMPMTIRSGQQKSFDFERMKSATTNTTNHHQYSVEVTANPAWSAIQALPYLIEFPYECAEQTYSRLYANAITLHIMNSNEDIKKMFDTWKNSKQGRDPLMSALEQNEELKSLLLKETPWVREAKNETEAKRRLAELFDTDQLTIEISRAAKRLLDLGYHNGWPWFDGGKVSPYITNHLVASYGHLKKLGVASEIMKIKNLKLLSNKINDAVRYLDRHEDQKYWRIKKRNQELYVSRNILHYFYSRSFYLKEIPLPNKEWVNIYKSILKKDWKERGLQEQAMMAISFYRMGELDFAKMMLKSLKERGTVSEERGMFWEQNQSSYYWWTSNIETQALLIEAFNEVNQDKKAVENMRIWLLRNKETNSWNSTKSTAYACYSLLLGGENWLTDEHAIEISVAGKVLKVVKSNPKNSYEVMREPGTGYIKTSWKEQDVKTKLSKIDITNTGKTVAFGSAYWEYFENLDKITSSGTNPIKVEKLLYLKKGEDLHLITKNTTLKIGDEVSVRLSINADRDMEFVHIKDMRASAFEPTEVLSKHRHQNGTWYFQSTKDASVDLFFDFIPKGTYQVSYGLFVTHSGNFSNGICSVECMYAPQFTSHTAGMSIVVE